MQTNGEGQQTRGESDGTHSHSPASSERSEPHDPSRSHERSVNLAHWTSTVASIVLLFVIGYQTCLNRTAIDEGTKQFDATIREVQRQSETLSRILIEQQRARLSFAINADPVVHQGQPRFRLLLPIEIGGTTEARRVRLKYYQCTGEPRQSDYLSSNDIDWERDAYPLTDVSPTEQDRQFRTDPLTQNQLAIMQSSRVSLYFVARLEYCDIYGECRYFMRCAELSDRLGFVSYCGTRVGALSDAEADQES